MMLEYVARRLLVAVPTLVLVLTVVFVLVRVVPGDPALTILGDQASQEAIRALHARLGLDRPIHVQYLDFVRGALTGDLGASMVSGQAVLRQVLDVLPHTAELTLASVILGVLLGVPAGMAAALSRNRLGDYVTRILSLLGLSFPSFVSAVLLLLAFAIHLRWFPVVTENDLGTAAARARNLVLPALCLGSIMAAYVTRVTRSAMLDVLREDYVRTARAKGLATRAVVWHALRNALIPVTTVVGLYLGILVGNSVLVEVVFARPGLGKLIVGALSQRDYTLLQGLMVVYAFIIVLVNLVTDLTYGLVDPRITVAK
jgi:ABC-type dipeptide/oligopeptide/nickel transport system permease component